MHKEKYFNKRLLLCISIMTAITLNLAHAKGPYTPQKGSLERKAILDALRDQIKSVPRSNIVFVVNYLMVKDGWAWIETHPQSPDGRNKFEPIDALFHKEKGKWTVKQTRPCCGDCADDPECVDIKRYYRKLMRLFPSVPPEIFPK